MPKLSYLGHSTFLVEGEQGSVIIDPFLTGNPKASCEASEIEVDAVLVSHAHGDHIADVVEIANRCDAQVVSTYELAEYFGSKGVSKCHPLHIGGAADFSFGRVKLTIAFHGSVTPDGVYGGMPAGILLTMDGKTLYHAGDTALTLEMKLLGERHAIDCALLPIGDNFTMGIDDAVTAAEFVGAPLVVPMHYDTFGYIEVDAGDFKAKVDAQGRDCRVLAPGESLEY